MAIKYIVVKKSVLDAMSGSNRALLSKTKGLLMDPESTAPNAIAEGFSNMEGTTFASETILLSKNFNAVEDAFAEEYVGSTTNCEGNAVSRVTSGTIDGAGSLSWTVNEGEIEEGAESRLIFNSIVALTPGTWFFKFDAKSSSNYGTKLKVGIGTSRVAATTTLVNGFTEQTIQRADDAINDTVNFRYGFTTTHNANAYVRFRISLPAGETILIDNMEITNSRGARVNIKTETGGDSSPYISGGSKDQYIPHSISLTQTNLLSCSDDKFFVVLQFDTSVGEENTLATDTVDVIYDSIDDVLTATTDGNTYGKSFTGNPGFNDTGKYLTSAITAMSSPTPINPCNSGWTFDNDSQRCEED
tara:strand:- start:9274 stop:10350 length:1077 start_codon:yes stop_codon:yes gene_type:complete